MERLTRQAEGENAYTLAEEESVQAAIERLGRYEDLHEALLDAYARVLSRMDVLRAADKTKTATYQQLLAEKLMLTNLLDRFQLYGIPG